MIFKCGIIGLPNVGKSTLFNALTFSSVKAENFPFCTIKANRGFVSIIDDRLFRLAELIDTKSLIYGNIEVIDIAGLVKGASQGEGLGNNFLSDISKVDILCHVVRCFKNLDIYHVNNEINPRKDINIIHDELILFDITLCERIIFLLKKNVRNNDENNIKILRMLQKCLVTLNHRILLYNSSFTSEEKKILRRYNFITFKPIIYVANVDDKSNINNRYVSVLSSIAINEKIQYLSMCFLCKKGKKEESRKYSKFMNIVKTVFQVLQLKTFFTINSKKVRSWIISKNIVAIEASDIIHSDFKKKFIRVQVLKYNDFIMCGGWKMAKKLGKIRTEGKDYLIEDGDILNFLI